MMIKQNHIAINVSDRDKAVAFYRDVLGFSILSEKARPHKHDILIFMESHGVVIELFVDATRPARLTEPEALGLRHLCFTVADARQTWERIKALGYDPEPIRQCPGYRMFFVKDPDGLPIEFQD